MNEFMKTYQLKITTLTPVHIGTSSDLEPTEYVIYSENEEADNVICPECRHQNSSKDDLCGNCGCPLPKLKKEAEPVKGKSFLYTFTPAQLSQALSSADKAQLLKVAKNGTTAELKNFFKGKASAISKFATKRAIVSPSIEKKYQEEKTENRLFIEKQISDSVTGSPYIPGSSLKGAIRTALMSKRNESVQINRSRFIKIKGAGKKVEKQLYQYDKVASDPFKALKLCDALPKETCLTHIYDLHRETKKNDIPGTAEVIPQNTLFLSSLSLMKETKPINFDETIETIRNACNDFYWDVFCSEIKRKWGKVVESLMHVVENRKNCPNTFIINIGKNSGAESKTIKNLRMIENRKTHTLMEHSETYWMICDKDVSLPFGWCVVEYEEVK